MAHADCGPSYLPIALNCPASVTKARGIQGESNAYARKGTALHTAVEETFKTGEMPKQVVVDGEIIVLDAEDIEAVQMCVDTAHMLSDGVDAFGLEERLNMKWFLGDGMEPVFGTTDLVAYRDVAKVLTVADWKFGRRAVAPTSPQIWAYALMAIGSFSLAKKVRLVIVQPFTPDPIRSIEITKEELLTWAVETLAPALRRIGAGDTSENPGDHCRYCRRAASCVALRDRAYEVAKRDFDETHEITPQGFSSAELAEILDKADLVEGWIKQVRAEASRRLGQGEDVPGYKLVQKRATRKWKTDLNIASELLDFGLEAEAIYEAPSVLSPAQMEKVLKKNGFDVKIIESLVTRESSGSTLARQDDARPALTSGAAALFD